MSILALIVLPAILLAIFLPHPPLEIFQRESPRQNGNDDVVSAIDKLRKDLGNVKGDTYNVGDV